MTNLSTRPTEQTDRTPEEMDAKIFLSIVLILSSCCLVAQTQISDCCLAVKNKPIKNIHVVDYKHQIAGQGCLINATVLMTRHGRKLCVPLGGPWITPIITHVTKLKTYCKGTNCQKKRCFGVTCE